ncbi:VWA domain-containing protein [Labrys wisconsinensis]|uniref:Ca-activated chloride channel family protein n=1 Tax=Labrys wisconsinensis TaxID=425677 RepID=A0ABU0JD95_9HYPH|nr:VWA domain-containing protein [Labrys wisconsinensis]MDQ0472252.1 Ca-activated chloride channel family protein [Labrys wisconsinensis]
MTLPDLALLRPAWLLAPPLLLVLALLACRRGGLGDWRRAVDPHLMAVLERRGAMVAAARQGLALSPWLLAAAAIGAALAGPAIRRSGAETFRNLDALVIALDVSRSVAEGGALPEARLAAMQVAEAAGSRQVALVLFAGDAYLAADFSTDRDLLRPLLLGATTELVPDGGSRPARAVALARALLGGVGTLGGDVVLVTDGGGADAAARAAARDLAAAGHRLHVLFVPAPTRRPTAPEPERAAAAHLAEAGGGAFADVLDPAPVVAAAGGDAGTRLGAGAYAALVWRDLGRAGLVLAAVPLLLLFRRRA